MDIRKDFQHAVQQLPEHLRGMACDRTSHKIDGRWKLCAADGSELRAAPAATRAAPQQANRALPEHLARTLPGKQTAAEVLALKRFAATHKVRLVYDDAAGRWVAR